ncbi:glutathione S-transferase, C-terminal domain [Shewanella halifaxensis HAW-EB4]|uniref:Glutathione S-transferase, C-terminal domain n=1 Tax=Shewanella halifaxensis (strain HAW-EB4) TaxID=458817 RepID=B0TJF4_SHEHH|nr:glutathione S-transferase family protein [Shewanella halifaxensis]ABZ76950.1 glutathione S-transferase, C-terminal domain [Shewanella halifaxensis HAW-EB4]
MGLLQNGQWVDQWYSTKDRDGQFQREESSFRHWITADGQPIKTGETPFKAEKGRYHLYVSLACPWAHRTLIFRVLKGLKDFISVIVVEPHMLGNGWEFAGRKQSKLAHHIIGADRDTLNQADYLYQIYQKAQANYNGRVTVPVLWDKQNQTIVSNESSEIIRMLNSEFDQLTGNELDFYPRHLRQQIDKLNNFIYSTINNGVYKAGFATTQTAYNQAYDALFDALDKIERILEDKRYLTGSDLTEADLRLFTTLIRFDAVYVGHFKTNMKRIVDYSNLQGYLKDIYQRPGVASTVNFEHIKQHYYFSHDTINPTRIVPNGPVLDLTSTHGRG